MVAVLLAGLRTFARDLRGEVALFVVLIGGICVLNLVKLVKLLAWENGVGEWGQVHLLEELNLTLFSH